MFNAEHPLAFDMKCIKFRSTSLNEELVLYKR